MQIPTALRPNRGPLHEPFNKAVFVKVGYLDLDGIVYSLDEPMRRDKVMAPLLVEMIEAPKK